MRMQTLTPVKRCRSGVFVATVAASLFAGPPALADTGLQPLLVDTWLTQQRNPDGSTQWTLEPRFYLPYAHAGGWVTTLRVDVPLVETNATGPAKSTPGYSGGVGNVFVEAIAQTPELAPRFGLRGSLRLVFPSPKGEPFGKDDQYQIAPMAGMIWQLPEALRGVTVSPYVRWLRGFDAQTADTTLVDTLNLYPTVSFGLGEGWALTFYKEAGPITYERNTRSWFVPLDLGIYRSLEGGASFGFGGAFKLGEPSSPPYDYRVYVQAALRF